MSNLTIYRGDSKTYNLTFTENGAALDITGYTIFFTVKTISDVATDDSEAVISKTVTSHTNPTGGITQVVLSSTDTNIDVDEYDYDFQFKTDADAITTFQKGRFNVLKDITRRTS